MQIGEVYVVRPECAPPGSVIRRRGPDGKLEIEKLPVEGKVIWVHPKGRYAVLEFEGLAGNPRESFFPEQLTEKNRVVNKRKGKR